ncbi:MAG TPA: glycosyltransferase [Phycisphaerae bacterium]|nr:glycosyltransferase [Phycisphaerae bacterium]
MRIAQITPGSGGGFYCENCLRDKEAVRQLRAMGHDAMMVPLYLPPLGWEPDGAAGAPIFYGGINVYLQQKWRLFRRTPRWLDRVFDSPPLLALAGRMAGAVRPEGLGQTTLSMLRGEHGRQRKELDRLVEWLARSEKPDVVILSNVLLIGLARRIRESLGAAVVCLLQDEDEFLDALREPYRSEAWDTVARRAADVDRFVAVSDYYKAVMVERLDVSEDRIDVVRVGIAAEEYSPADAPPDPPVIGFLSRIYPPKGLDILIEALAKLKSDPRLRDCRCRAAGGWTAADKPYLRKIRKRLDELGLTNDVELLPDLAEERRKEFLRSLSVLSVPARRSEASGRYVLEALAAGVPVVQPQTGVFPELLAATRGGTLCRPEDPDSVAAALRQLLLDPPGPQAVGKRGREAVIEKFHVRGMAEGLLAACSKAAAGR